MWNQWDTENIEMKEMRMEMIALEGQLMLEEAREMEARGEGEREEEGDEVQLNMYL